MMQDHDNLFGDHQTRREAWRIAREAKRAAWRARRAARHARRADWSHFGDPKFWGLDAESLKHWGFGGAATGAGQTGFGRAGCASTGSGAAGFGHAGFGHMGGGDSDASRELAELKVRLADMEKIIASLSSRVIVLEKLAVDDDRRLAAEIEKLRGSDQ
jgi:hypothetical protein